MKKKLLYVFVLALLSFTQACKKNDPIIGPRDHNKPNGSCFAIKTSDSAGSIIPHKSSLFLKINITDTVNDKT